MDFEIEAVKNLAFEEFCCAGVEEFSLNERQVDDILGKRAFSGGPLTDDVLIDVEDNQRNNGLNFTFYFYGENQKQNAESFALVAKKNCDGISIMDVKKEACDDWNKNWRSGFAPISVTKNITIVPEWLKNETDDETNVYIYTGMGFGTGNHDTTYLCLEAIDKIMS